MAAATVKEQQQSEWEEIMLELGEKSQVRSRPVTVRPQAVANSIARQSLTTHANNQTNPALAPVQMEDLRVHIKVNRLFPRGVNPDTTPIKLDHLQKLARVWKMHHQRGFWAENRTQADLIRVLHRHMQVREGEAQLRCIRTYDVAHSHTAARLLALLCSADDQDTRCKGQGHESSHVHDLPSRWRDARWRS